MIENTDSTATPIDRLANIMKLQAQFGMDPLKSFTSFLQTWEDPNDSSASSSSESSSTSSVSEPEPEVIQKEKPKKCKVTLLPDNPFDEVPELAPQPKTVFQMTSQELAQPKVLATMKKQLVIGDVFIATGGFTALNIFSVRGIESPEPQKKLKRVLLIGMDSSHQIFWKGVQEIVIASKDRFEAFTKINHFLYKKRKELFGQSADEECERQQCDLLKEFASGQSWLSSEERFECIRENFRSKHIDVKTINLWDPGSFDSIVAALQLHEFKVDSLYLSNLAETAMQTGNLEQYCEGMQRLMSVISKDTLLIDLNLQTKEQKVRRNIQNEYVAQLRALGT